METPEASLRAIGIGSAVVGLILVWLVRGEVPHVPGIRPLREC